MPAIREISSLLALTFDGVLKSVLVVFPSPVTGH